MIDSFLHILLFSNRLIPLTDLSRDGAEQWLPKENPFPFPDCSVVSHASVVLTPATLTLDLDIPSGGRSPNNDQSVCDDPFFLKQVSYA